MSTTVSCQTQVWAVYVSSSAVIPTVRQPQLFGGALFVTIWRVKSRRYVQWSRSSWLQALWALYVDGSLGAAEITSAKRLLLGT